MNKDFHCYATYCAAILAGYSHEESAVIGYSSQMVDLCTRTMLSKLHAPQSAATTQLQLELMDARTGYHRLAGHHKDLGVVPLPAGRS